MPCGAWGGGPPFTARLGYPIFACTATSEKFSRQVAVKFSLDSFCARAARARANSHARREFHGPQIANVRPGFWTFTNSVLPSGENTRPRTRASWDAGCARCDGNVPVVSHPRRGSRGVRGCPRRRRGRPWAHHSPVPAWSLAPCACDRPARNGGSTSGAGSSLRTQSISHDSPNSIAGRDFQFCVRSPGRPTTSSASRRPRRA